MPPTRITSFISLEVHPASLSALRHGSTHLFTRSSTRDSNLARVILMLKCLGPEASAVMKGKFTSVSELDDNSCLAFSAASLRRCSAILSSRRSIPLSFLNSSAKNVISLLSKSSPPRKVSPFVALTSNTPSPISRMEISNVPPPRSNTAIFSSCFLSRPYAIAAAVGSFMIRSTSSPAILPESLVACLWASLK